MARREDSARAPVAVQEFEFKLKIRVECLQALRQAAARRCAESIRVADDEIVELLGPLEDPSLEDCLMMLALPDTLAGCTMLSVSLDAGQRAA